MLNASGKRYEKAVYNTGLLIEGIICNYFMLFVHLIWDKEHRVWVEIDSLLHLATDCLACPYSVADWCWYLQHLNLATMHVWEWLWQCHLIKKHYVCTLEMIILIRVFLLFIKQI